MPQIEPSKGIVLHVEDDAAVASSIGLLLRHAGFRTVTVADGESALRCVTEGELRPDVLIVDANLPGEMDGSETAEAVCRALRQTLPTILLSGDLANAGLPWLPGVPIWPMAKPCSPELLVHAVETFTDLHRWTLQQAETPPVPVPVPLTMPMPMPMPMPRCA